MADKVPLARLRTYYKNPRRGDVDLIAASLKRRGQYRPIVVNRGTSTGRKNEILAGNHTFMAARKLGWETIEVHYIDVDEDMAAEIVVADNGTADRGDYDQRLLAELLESLPTMEATGYGDDDLLTLLGSLEDTTPERKMTLAERFGAPPMTVLNARGGDWQARKKFWRGLGIKSEIGRSDGLVYDVGAIRYTNWMPVKNNAVAKYGSGISDDEVERIYLSELKTPSDRTSVFDPALCELIVRWYSAPGDRLLDPWAGGSVRGLVSAALGRDYLGIDLREEQVRANRDQKDIVLENARSSRVFIGEQGNPEWEIGDSTEVLERLAREGAVFDGVIGCPPYYDLEEYGDDPKDLSNMTPTEFEAAIRRNVAAVAAVMRDDSFATFVVGGVRDKRGLVRDMRRLFSEAGEAVDLRLYNDAILITPVGSIAITAARTFSRTRALSRTHQEVLTFVKGDRKRAALAAGEVDSALTPYVAEDGEQITDEAPLEDLA